MTSNTIPALLGLLVSASLVPVPVAAQGQDSTPWERDLQVIGAMLPGLYSNANQSYFDRRVGRPVQHEAVEASIVTGNVGDEAFDLSLTAASGEFERRFRLHLEAGDSAGVPGLRVEVLTGPPPAGAMQDAPPPPCRLTWQRSAAEFVAEQAEPCHAGAIERLVLSEDQLWIALQGSEAARFELHRARRFECYADIPGVGGGRDEPYDRYDGLELHDQGGSAWGLEPHTHHAHHTHVHKNTIQNKGVCQYLGKTGECCASSPNLLFLLINFFIISV